MSDEGLAAPPMPLPRESWSRDEEIQFRRVIETHFAELDGALKRIIAQADADVAAITTGITLLEEQAPASVSSADFSTGIDDTYGEYIFVLTNVVPATDNVALWLRSSTDGGSTYDAGASDYAWRLLTNATTTTDTTDAQIELTTATIGSDTNENGFTGRVHLFDPAGAEYTAFRHFGIYDEANGDLYIADGGGKRLAAEDVDAVRFMFSSGDIESGTIRLYGVTKS